MTIFRGRFKVDIVFILSFVFISSIVEGGGIRYVNLSGVTNTSKGISPTIGRRGLIEKMNNVDPSVKIFDVTKHGAVADDNTDNFEAFMQTWLAACASIVPAKVVVPQGTFLTGTIVFQGPCKGPRPIIFEVRGIIKATTDVTQYPDGNWVVFEIIDGLILNGGGTFDGQGGIIDSELSRSAWSLNDCKTNPNCAKLPTSIKMNKVNNSVVHNIKSVNSKFFHMHVTNSHYMTIHSINIIAPHNSPNTEGIHISSSSNVNVTSSFIGTGDDCISIGDEINNVSISNIFCGPGHGISVGSLGKYEDEKPVNEIFVRNCTFSNTFNGARIKTYAGSGPNEASNIIFEDIIMNNVKLPIVIDQKYNSRKITIPSRVKVTNVHFKNIRGTSTSNVAVNFLCSSLIPCEGVELVDINLVYSGTKVNGTTLSSCVNAKIKTSGVQIPTPCT